MLYTFYRKANTCILLFIENNWNEQTEIVISRHFYDEHSVEIEKKAKKRREKERMDRTNR